MELKRTPLCENHRASGAKMVAFAGWEMPVQYTGVIPEHTATRTKAGLFDVSHMGEIFVEGTDAEKLLEHLTCNSVSSLSDGRAQYSALLNETGGVVDDIIIYRYSRERYLVCVNAGNTDTDFAWMKSNNPTSATVKNESAFFGQIALQGPIAKEIVYEIPELRACSALEYFGFKECLVGGVSVIVARTGYTGEDGFEFFVPAHSTEELWKLFLEVGTPRGLVPCGLGARDSLRLEACYPLHGHELLPSRLAYESGLGWIVKLQKGAFIGKEALEREKAQGVAKSLVGFFVVEAGIVRENAVGYAESGEEIGIVTSGTKTPTVNRALGLAVVKREFATVGSTFVCDVRGRRLRCEVVQKPFYKRS